MQSSSKPERRGCPAIVSTSSGHTGSQPLVQLIETTEPMGRWSTRSNSLSCNGDLCPVVISSPYCKRSNTTATLTALMDYELNEKSSLTKYNHHQVIISAPNRENTAATQGIHLSQGSVNPSDPLVTTHQGAGSDQHLRVRPPSAPPSYHSLISLAGLDCIDYPDYHFDNLDHPGTNPDLEYLDHIQLDCSAESHPTQRGKCGSRALEYSTSKKRGSHGNPHRQPPDGYHIPSALGSPSLRATCRMMRKHYR